MVIGIKQSNFLHKVSINLVVKPAYQQNKVLKNNINSKKSFNFKGNSSEVISKIAKKIEISSGIAIFPHKNLDGDTIASALALLKGILNKWPNKKAFVFTAEDTPLPFKFLAGADSLVNMNFSNITKRRKNFALDIIEKLNTEWEKTAIFIDCSSEERISNPVKNFTKIFTNKINIDHHSCNSGFGNLNWVNPDSAFCGEMLPDLFNTLKIEIDKDMANCLATSILDDTGNLQHSYSIKTEQTLRKLLQKSDNRDFLLHNLALRTPAAIKMEEEAVKNTVFEQDGIAYTVLTNKLKSTLKVTQGDFLNVSSVFMNSCGTKIGFILNEVIKSDSKAWLISLRSRDNRINVAEIAKKLGGNGHPAASACKMENTSLEEAKAKVLYLIRQQLKCI